VPSENGATLSLIDTKKDGDEIKTTSFLKECARWGP
jgi:hypothetical protein